MTLTMPLRPPRIEPKTSGYSSPRYSYNTCVKNINSQPTHPSPRTLQTRHLTRPQEDSPRPDAPGAPPPRMFSSPRHSDQSDLQLAVGPWPPVQAQRVSLQVGLCWNGTTKGRKRKTPGGVLGSNLVVQPPFNGTANLREIGLDAETKRVDHSAEAVKHDLQRKEQQSQVALEIETER